MPGVAAAAEDEEGVPGDQVPGQVQAGRAGGVARGVPQLDLGRSQLDLVSAVVQDRLLRAAAPEIGLGLHQVKAGVGRTRSEEGTRWTEIETQSSR